MGLKMPVSIRAANKIKQWMDIDNNCLIRENSTLTGIF